MISNLQEKLRELKRDQLISLVKDLLSSFQGFPISEYEADTIVKPDLVQKSPTSGEFDFICEIKRADIKKENLFTIERDQSERIARGYISLRFIVVYPFALSHSEKLRIQQDYQLFFKRDLRIYDLNLFINGLNDHPEFEEKYFPILETWHEAYTNLAHNLGNFYRIHQEFTSRKLFSLMRDSPLRNLLDSLFIQGSEDDSERGINPIQIFASFNDYSITKSRRSEIISAYLKILGSTKKLSYGIQYNGIPSAPIYQMLRFRDEVTTSKIWNIYSNLLNKGIGGITPDQFAAIRSWRGIDIPSFTIFLFWIDSTNFIPLDNKTAKYIRDLGIIKSRLPTANQYTDLCKHIQQRKLFTELADPKDAIRIIVREAQSYSDAKAGPFSLSGSTQSVTTSIVGDNISKTERQNKLITQQGENEKGLKIIAIKPTDSSNSSRQKHLKNLKVNQIYKFYQCFDFKNNDDHEINYFQEKDIDFYHLDQLKVSVCAIVGMNGAGKSTLADFLYLIINKIAHARKFKSDPEFQDQEIFADLYFQTDGLFRLSIGNDIKLYKYVFDEKNSRYLYSMDGEVDFKSYDFSNFFYTIALNYSLYGLNSKIVGSWITPLFHKNDSYQTPLVLNPKRTDGKININIEYTLAKSRLLFNLLDPVVFEMNNRIVPPLVEGAVPQKLIFTVRKKDLKSDPPNAANVEKVISALGIKLAQNIEFVDFAKHYIYRKVKKIPLIYSKFSKYVDFENSVLSNEVLLEEYCSRLRKESSHLAFKLNQAINYLELGLYRSTNENSIEFIIESIERVLNTSDEGKRTIDLIPPAFLKTDIIFRNGSSFNKMSSGQKQFVFSLNTVAYHLFNLQSIVLYENDFKYSAVNIIFDEIELYFHPDMQRKFVHELLTRIKSLQLAKNEDIRSLNLVFITHSPFILSDIPKSNVLMLKMDEFAENTTVAYNENETFAANVHDLLANEFYLKDGFMGEFAKNSIKDLIDFLTKRSKSDKYWNKASAKQFINTIGEPYLRDDLLNLYHQKFFETQSQIDAEIEMLQQFKNSLR